MAFSNELSDGRCFQGFNSLLSSKFFVKEDGQRCYDLFLRFLAEYGLELVS